MTTVPLQSRKAAKFLFGFFIVLAVGTFTWGFFVVEKVRARAKETDGALRAVAWACLCYAQQNGQQSGQQSGQKQASHLWPDSEATLITATSAGNCEKIDSPNSAWPATREAAMAGSTAPATLPLALGMAGVEFSKDPQACPHLTAKGNPSGLDTLEVVNGWLIEYAKSHFLKSHSAPN